MQEPSEGEEGEGDNGVSVGDGVVGTWVMLVWFVDSIRFLRGMSSTLLFGFAQGWVPRAVVFLRLYERYESGLRSPVYFPFAEQMIYHRCSGEKAG